MEAVTQRVQSLVVRVEHELQLQGVPGTENRTGHPPWPKKYEHVLGRVHCQMDRHTIDGLMMYRHTAWGTVNIAGHSFSPTPCPGGLRTKG